MSIFCLITSLSSHCLTCPPQLVKILNILCINIILLWVIGIIYFPVLIKKIDVYVNRKVDMNVKYTVYAIQDLCEMCNEVACLGMP